MLEELKDLIAEKNIYNNIRKAFEEKYGDIVKKNLRRYINAYHPTNMYYGFPGDDAVFNWEIDENYVYVDWEENWNYGGHDQGYFSMPINYLWDDEALKNYEQIRQKEKKEIEEKEKQEQLDKKRQEYERLKREIGE